MSDIEYLGLILAMGVVTYVPRWIPLFLFSQKPMPRWLIEWLDLIPVSILSALVIPELVTRGVPRELDLFQTKVLAAIPTLAFAVKTRSLGGTVLVGMLLYWVLEKL